MLLNQHLQLVLCYNRGVEKLKSVAIFYKVGGAYAHIFKIY